jgi:hypothetical protein
MSRVSLDWRLLQAHARQCRELAETIKDDRVRDRLVTLAYEFECMKLRTTRRPLSFLQARRARFPTDRNTKEPAAFKAVQPDLRCTSQDNCRISADGVEAALSQSERGMRSSIKLGDRVRLSEIGRRGAKKPTRTGIVVGISRSGTQLRVRWDDLLSPQLLHINYLELAAGLEDRKPSDASDQS